MLSKNHTEITQTDNRVIPTKLAWLVREITDNRIDVIKGKGKWKYLRLECVVTYTTQTNETTATKTRFMMYLRKKILWCLNMDMVYRNLIKNIECKWENKILTNLTIIEFFLKMKMRFEKFKIIYIFLKKWKWDLRKLKLFIYF